MKEYFKLFFPLLFFDIFSMFGSSSTSFSQISILLALSPNFKSSDNPHIGELKWMMIFCLKCFEQFKKKPGKEKYTSQSKVSFHHVRR